MSGLQPVGVYALRVPPGDIMVPAVPDFAPVQFRATMAAIDPSAEPEIDEADGKRPARATLKIIRVRDDMIDDDEDDEDYLEGLDGDDSEDSDEEADAGPSTKKSKKQKLLEALAADADEDEDMSEDDSADEEMAEKIKALINGKGKGKALGDDEEEDSEDDSSDETVEMEEIVICTLDPEKHYQQPLDFSVGEGERVFFKVSGTHTIHITGNYVIPIDGGRDSMYDDEDESDEEDDYDLSPDEDELDALDELEALEEEESDDLDDLQDPRITEVDSEEEKAKKTTAKTKGKNKRPAADESDEDMDAAPSLDELIAKSTKKAEVAAVAAAAINGDAKKLSKAEKKAAKKLKKNDGEAAAVTAPATVTETIVVKKDKDGAPASTEKKVQFAKNLEQGPTPSATPPSSNKKDDKKASEAKPTSNSGASLGVKDVQGVTVDDRKLGTGPAAKKGSKLEMRYIGKLENGKVFDSNKSGKPFGVKVGIGEVIKGWDVGLIGMTAGGERRLTIPAHLAYGNKALPGIPKNSKLIFDVKCLSVK